MSRMPPEDQDVLVVTSRPAGPEGRTFHPEAPEAVEAPELPEALTHEDALVGWLAERGWRLTMVGGGSRPDEVRRFYFRPGGPTAGGRHRGGAEGGGPVAGGHGTGGPSPGDEGTMRG